MGFKDSVAIKARMYETLLASIYCEIMREVITKNKSSWIFTVYNIDGILRGVSSFAKALSEKIFQIMMSGSKKVERQHTENRTVAALNSLQKQAYYGND